MPAWEYHILHTSIRLKFQELWTASMKNEASNWEKIQQLGREGWELVSVLPLQSPEGGTAAMAWVFKRPTSSV